MNHALLQALFDKNIPALPRELRKFAAVLGSPVSPDKLEGMWRSGGAFGIDVPHPSQLANAIVTNLFDTLILDKHFSQSAIAFHRKAAEIYNTAINKPSAIEWESAWALAMQKRYDGLSLAETLLLSEDQIVAAVMRDGPPKATRTAKYKVAPILRVNPPLQRSLPTDLELDELARVLVHS